MGFLGKLWFKFVFVYIAAAIGLVALSVYMIVTRKPSGGELALWVALPVAWILAYEPIMVWREWQRVKGILKVCHEKLKAGEQMDPQELEGSFKFFARLGSHETGMPEWLCLWLLRKWGRRAIEEIQARMKAKEPPPASPSGS